MGLHGTSLEQSIGLPHNHDNRWVDPNAEEDPDIQKVSWERKKRGNARSWMR